MNELNILSQDEAASKQLHYEAVVGGAKEEMKPDLNGFALDAMGLSFLLRASLSSSTLFRYDSNMERKHENATTISPDRELQETTSTKKRIISAKEAGRLALLHLEEAEARRLRYADELARFPTEREESEEKAALNKNRISAKEARRLVLLDMERAEERRRQYVEELARLQTELFKLGD